MRWCMELIMILWNMWYDKKWFGDFYLDYSNSKVGVMNAVFLHSCTYLSQ